MKIIDDQAAFDAALACFTAAVAHLLIERRDQLLAGLDPGADIHGYATFVIVEPRDLISAVEAAVGFPIAHEYPPWEWVLDHGQLYEAPIITSDDGAGVILIVPDQTGIDPTLLSMLRAQAEQTAAANT